jgi:hypothetical protein
MKRTILLISLITVFFSCTQNEKQIDVAKVKLIELNVSKAELDKYEFCVDEILEKDMYVFISDYYMAKGREWSSMDYLKKAEKYLNLISTAKEDKICYRVRALRIIGDTINDKTFFIDDKNTIVDYINKK